MRRRAIVCSSSSASCICTPGILAGESDDLLVSEGKAVGKSKSPVMRTFTITEAASTTGVTPKAIRRRIERGTLRSVLGPDQRRRIPLSELQRAGLIPAGEAHGGAAGQGYPDAPPPGNAVGGVLEVGILLERLERLAAENGRLRVLEERAGSLERQVEAERAARANAEQELFAARARVVELESPPRRRRWFSRERSGSPRTAASA